MAGRRASVFRGKSEGRVVSPRRTVLGVALLLGVALAPHCAIRPHPATQETMTAASSGMEASAETAAAAIVPVESDDPFVATVRPVLSVRCAPCHNPGGKMHGRLPFDDAKTVASNSAGILRRLKGDDRAALEKWIAGLP
jgi:hypothetical protein